MQFLYFFTFSFRFYCSKSIKIHNIGIMNFFCESFFLKDFSKWKQIPISRGVNTTEKLICDEST